MSKAKDETRKIEVKTIINFYKGSSTDFQQISFRAGEHLIEAFPATVVEPEGHEVILADVEIAGHLYNTFKGVVIETTSFRKLMLNNDNLIAYTVVKVFLAEINL